jgi:hypothetical protein
MGMFSAGVLVRLRRACKMAPSTTGMFTYLLTYMARENRAPAVGANRLKGDST